MRSIEAKYVDGQLRPAHPLLLRPGELVEIVSVRKPDPARWDLNRLAVCAADDEALSSAGLDEWARALADEDQH
jgi:hypothetical protein